MDALNSYRYDAADTSPLALEAQEQWGIFFCRAIERACEQSLLIHHDIEEVLGEYLEHIENIRRKKGMRALRMDSATFTILNNLPSAPVLTARSAAQIFGLSKVAATHALNDLSEAGVLSLLSSGNEQNVYYARALLDLITLTERRLASTHFDTRTSPPNRATPASP